jgi:anti-sigma factor RsiW
MSAELHGFQPEEVMAYLDGEITGERALALADHLQQCAECSELADDFCALSQQLIAWKIEPSPLVESPAILGVDALTAEEAMGAFKFDKESIAALRPAQESAPAAGRKSSLLSSFLDFIWRPRIRRPWVWALASACAVLVIVSLLSLRMGKIAPSQSVPAHSSYKTKTQDELARELQHAQKNAPLRAQKNQVSVDGADATDNSVNGLNQSVTVTTEAAPASPQDLPAEERSISNTILSRTSREPAQMIEKTASLSLIVKEMDATRTSLEDIAKRHHSYFAELNTVGQSEAGRTLTASLRVPADELDATLAELRKLGQLSEEKQGGEEVSQQYVDLKARLDNARHTEKRLTELLTKRADKLKDVLDVEREIASTREDIERMEAQQRNIKNQVSYASIDLKLRQEYKPALHLGPPAIGTRLRNALVDGYHSAVESALGLVLFLFQEGPSILFWLLVLFFPARWTLRKLRAAAAQKHSMAGAL